jgi:hypothetical protein
MKEVEVSGIWGSHGEVSNIYRFLAERSECEATGKT